MEGGSGDERLVLRAVEPVTGEGMADGCHVDAQLMGASGVGDETQQSPAAAGCQHFVFRYGALSVRPLTDISPVAAYVKLWMLTSAGLDAERYMLTSLSGDIM